MMNILTTASIRAGYVMMLNLIAKWFTAKWDRWFPPNGGVLPQPPKNPYNAATNDLLKKIAADITIIEQQRIEATNQLGVPNWLLPGEPIRLLPGVPTDRTVRVPKDVWAELQAMPNDGSWSTRQLVRAIQRANKKKRGAP